MPDVVEQLVSASDDLSRQEEPLATLLRESGMTPAWHPEHPTRAADRELLDNLVSCRRAIDKMRECILGQRERRFAELKEVSPFRPADLLARCGRLELLLGNAKAREGARLLALLTKWDDAPASVSDLIPRVRRLAADQTRGVSHAAAAHATGVAYEGTRYWRLARTEYLDQHESGWRSVIERIDGELNGQRHAVRLREGWHDQGLRAQAESDVTCPEASALVAEAAKLVAAAGQLGGREEHAVHVVSRVSRGAQRLTRSIARDAPDLDGDDNELVSAWAASNGGSAFSARAMESARRAELVALDIYRGLFGGAEDLSRLQQTHPADSRWRTADILAGGRWIDVKNARRSFSSPGSYSEHTVKALKSAPAGDVVVSGFLSPYLTEHDSHLGRQVVWLGETSRADIDALTARFGGDGLEVNLTCGGGGRVPPWLFDYPPECYAGRDAALARVRSPEFAWPRSPSPVGLLVIAGRLGRGASGDPIWEEAHELGRVFREGGRPTRPMLFLHVLRRFCDSARAGKPFHAEALRQILFPNVVGRSVADEIFPVPSGPPVSTARECALAVSDPLLTIDSLITVLESVAARCAQALTGFTGFRLAGPGIFQGRQGGGAWQTIFSYCGGWRTLRGGARVKCGQDPLHLGRERACDEPECGKLICGVCGYCSRRCRGCRKRQEGYAASECPVR